MTIILDDLCGFVAASRSEALPVTSMEWRALDQFARESRARRFRSIRAFAEEEIILPNGPYEGRLFLCDRQPFSRAWFDELESGRWRRFIATGPQQSGKTLLCLVIPVLWHLFELRETVVLGAPDEDVCADKWTEDLRPVIEASRYASLLPRRGPGSRAGWGYKITFRNGVSLRFMSGRGSDKSRAGYTAPVAAITELDGMDRPGPASRESDPVTQIEGRTDAYDDRARVYGECTISTEDGRTWSEYVSTTQTRLAIQCPECAGWVTPEREDLIGWKDAATETEAMDAGAWSCPECASEWTEAQRRQANQRIRVVHRGQTIDADGELHGEIPKTITLGFRWGAVHNLFVSPATIARKEWISSRAVGDDGEKELRQKVFAIPLEKTTTDLSGLSWEAVARRTTNHSRGVVPAACTRLTIAIDVGKYLCHWTLVGFAHGATPAVVDYGVIEVRSGEMAEDRALMAALRAFRDDFVEPGWPREDTGEQMTPDQAWIDARYLTDAVKAFCAESSSERYVCAMGHGTGQNMRAFRAPKGYSQTITEIAEGYYIEQQYQPIAVAVCHFDADVWKSYLHARLEAPQGEPGAMSLFRGSVQDHLAFGKHLTAEHREQEFRPKVGTVIVWRKDSRHNHHLDATSMACAAGHRAGARLMTAEPKPSDGKPRTLGEWVSGQKAIRGRSHL